MGHRVLSCDQATGAPGARLWWRDQRGFTGAEKALLITMALAIVLLVGSLIRGGSEKASSAAARVLAAGQGSVSSLGQAVDVVAAKQNSAQPGDIASTTAAVTTAPAPAKEEGFWGHVGGFFSGVYDGGKDAVVGIGNLAQGTWNLTGGWLFDSSASKQTWDHLTGTVSTVVNHPGQVWDAIKEPYVRDWNEGRPAQAIGRGTFEVITMVLGTKGLDKVAKAGKIGEAGKIAEVGSDLDKVADLGKTGKLTKVEGALDEAGDLSKGTKPDVAIPRPRPPTQLERTLAAESGNTLAQQAARKLVAEDYYMNQAGWNAKRTADHIGGIDFSKPVQIVDIPNGQLVQHIGANGKVGNYFAPLGTPAEELGINPAGRTPQVFDIPPGSKGLQSTAAPIRDTWTDAAHPYDARGGGTQIFVTDAQKAAIEAYNHRP